jgi:hypothetical protein
LDVSALILMTGSSVEEFWEKYSGTGLSSHTNPRILPGRHHTLMYSRRLSHRDADAPMPNTKFSMISLIA